MNNSEQINNEQVKNLELGVEQKRRKRRTKKLIFMIGATAIVFVVATYAWFLGISQVNVENFEISVKSAEGLTLSISGLPNSYTQDLTFTESDITTGLVSDYATHTNHWTGEDGLDPISSIGEIDATASRLKLFNKTSMTSLKGGYKLRASRIDNYSALEDGDGELVDEQNGYVAFDLFVKNISGDVYTKTYNNADDEGIYLSKTSTVTLSSEGKAIGEDGEETEEVIQLTGGDGIENSVRVAFMQIGRVSYSASAEVAQGITCETTSDVTGLCNVGPEDDSDTLHRGYTWNIWEPNDLKHTTDSVDHFNKICFKRSSATEYSDDKCNELADDRYFKTYAAGLDITATDNVNIYDGINSYTSSKLTEMKYFTDTIKNYNSDQKEEIFYLAPNSVTKIRVYIYLEGQDVDNFDLGFIGKKIKVTFGFTKDKFADDDVSEGDGDDDNLVTP